MDAVPDTGISGEMRVAGRDRVASVDSCGSREGRERHVGATRLPDERTPCLLAAGRHPLPRGVRKENHGGIRQKVSAQTEARTVRADRIGNGGKVISGQAARSYSTSEIGLCPELNDS